jgi:hypothetical protein
MSGLFFCISLIPKYGGSRFPQNICKIYQTIRHHIPEDRNLHSGLVRNSKCHIFILLTVSSSARSRIFKHVFNDVIWHQLL